jgi:hyperosmotically inducible protein
MKRTIVTVLLAVAVLTPLVPAQTPAQQRLVNQIRRELVTLPFLGVFDNLTFRLEPNGNVTLMGQVTRPTLKPQAANVIKDLEGVSGVDNQIEVLPLSPFDDRIRLLALRAIYGYPALQRYSLPVVHPIRIIVKNGNITLEGVVLNEGDKNIAGIRANGVPGAFSVTNNLQTEVTATDAEMADRLEKNKNAKKK